MLTKDERQTAIRQIRQLPDKLETALRGLNDAQLDTPYGEGKWTLRQVVHHLADSHLNALARMKLILTESKPTWFAYDQDAWAAMPDALTLSPQVSVSILKGVQERMAVMLEHISSDDWQRLGMHPERGEMTVDDLASLYGRHGEKHVGHIMGLRQAKGW
jgi:uncharacterized damage-inducible protein DinB